LKKSLLIALALLLLPVSMVVSTGTVSAARETEASLNKRLLTDAELKAALRSNDVVVNIAKTYDVPSIDDKDLLSSARRWDTSDGSILFSALVAYKDGRDLPQSRLDEVLSGQFAKDFASSFFDTGSVKYVGQLDPVVDQCDIGHAFEAKFDGKPLQAITISYVRGNIIGLALYATNDNEGTEVLSIFGGQLSKLPD